LGYGLESGLLTAYRGRIDPTITPICELIRDGLFPKSILSEFQRSGLPLQERDSKAGYAQAVLLLSIANNRTLDEPQNDEGCYWRSQAYAAKGNFDTAGADLKKWEQASLKIVCDWEGRTRRPFQSALLLILDCLSQSERWTNIW